MTRSSAIGLHRAGTVLLTKEIGDPAVNVIVKSDELTEKHQLRIQRMYHGNIKASIIDSDFVTSSDYKVLCNAAATFKGLICPGVMVRREWPLWIRIF